MKAGVQIIQRRGERGAIRRLTRNERTLVQEEEKMIKYVRALNVRKACLNVFHLPSQDA
jgi:hypothetical protein